MTRFGRHLRLRSYLMIQVLPLAMVLIVIIAFFASRALEREVHQSVADSLAHDGNQSRAALEYRIGNVVRQAEVLAENDLVINGMVDTENRENYLPVFFQSLKLAGIEGAKIRLTDYRGRVIAANRRDTPLEDASAPWLPTALAGQTVVTLSADGLVVAAPVRYAGLVEGVVVLELDAASLDALFALETLPVYAAIVDGQQRTLYAPGSAGVTRAAVLPWLAADSGWVVARSRFRDLEQAWLVVALSEQAVFARVHAQRLYLVVVFLTAGLAVVVGLIYAAHLAGRDIARLDDAIGRINREADLGRHVNPQGPRELQALSESFNTMLDRLRRTMTSKDAFNGILNSLSEVLVVTGPSGTVRLANPAAHSLADRLSVRNLTSITDLLDGTFKETDMALDAFLTPKAAREDVTIGYADDQAIAWSKSLLAGPDGTTEGMVFVGRDITARRRVARRLRLLERAVEAANDGLIICDMTRPDQPIIYVNAGFERLSGFDRGEIIGRNCRLLQGSDTDQPEIDALRSAIAARQSCRVVLRNYRKDGSMFWNELEIAPVPEADGPPRYYVGVISDITRRKEADTMKSQFVSTVSHELRTPLTSIKGALSLLRGGKVGALPERAQGMIDIAHGNCDRLVRLINDILDIEKIEAGRMNFHFTDVPVAALLDRAVAENRGFADRHQVVLQPIDDWPPVHVHGDGDRLLQVLANLISNAVKFSPEGAAVTLSAVARNGEVRIEVRDDGPGVPEAFRSRIFERFAQADGSDTRRHGGSGLGLNIAKAILDRHGGRIGFEDAPGGGTRFFVDLYTLEGLHDPPPDTGKPALLHVEDDGGLCNVVASILGEMADTRAARTLKEARSLLAAQRFDVVLLDIGLPDGAGTELLDDVRRLPYPPPVVVFAADAPDQAVGADVARVLIKSRTSETELATLLKGLLYPPSPASYGPADTDSHGPGSPRPGR